MLSPNMVFSMWGFPHYGQMWVKKLVMGIREQGTVKGVCTPQIGLDAECKQHFWEDMDYLIRGITSGENLFIV